MSSVLTAGGESRGQEFNPRPLSEKELEMVARLFSDPFAFPPEFMTWIRSSLERDPPLFTSSAIVGQFEPLPGSVINSSVATGANIDPDKIAAGYDLEKLPNTGEIGTSGVAIGSFGVEIDVNRGSATLAPLRINVNGVMKDVVVGAADSGGTGFKMLRVAN